MKHTIVVAEQIAEAGIAMLAEQGHVDVAIGVDRDELLGRLAPAHALVVRSATTVDAGMIAAAPNLQVIGRAGIGVDNVDLDAARERGVVVVNAPAANIISAAELTMALLLAQARHVAAADALTRSGVWDRARFGGVELYGKTLGIIGVGKIGALVGERARAFGMHVVGYDPYLDGDAIQARGADPMMTLADLYECSDYITVHLPRNSETVGLLDADAFARMKRGVGILNVSRGGIVDEDALADALASGQVGSAGLDVFSSEPLTQSRLFEFPQVTLTPHLGASTADAQDKAGTDVASAVLAELHGHVSPNRVT
jgi:D-3-phosphoglycerate dehydrogenase